MGLVVARNDMFFIGIVLALPMVRLLSSKAQGSKDFENCPNPVMLILIGKLSLSILR